VPRRSTAAPSQATGDVAPPRSARDAATAALVAPILDRQSATVAVTTKQPLIATMVEVHHAFPDVPLPIKVTPPTPHPRSEGGSDAI
jgi:hypothetical protein